MTDQELLGEIQDTLLEPNDGGLTFPSGLWTRQEVVDAVSDAQNQLLKATQLQIGFAAIDVLAGQARVALPEDWLITWNVVWIGDDDGPVREVVRASQFEFAHAHPLGLVTEGTPEVYFDNDQPLLQLQIAPAPNTGGTLIVWYVPEGPALGGVLAEPLAVPDEWASTVKYGALADLFGKDGRGRSPERAQYCRGRFDLGIEITRMILRSTWVGP